MFQSPPHRGTNCDSPRWHRSATSSPRVSVPSSSGNKLRRRIRARPRRRPAVSVPSSSGNKLRPSASRVAPRHPGFSPLLIGEQTATRRPASDTSSVVSFSPLLIGEQTATPLGQARVAICGSFSPLLIGEQTATPWLARIDHGGSSTFQSPPHRGTNCDSSDRPTACAGMCSRFSPLLIGEQTATSGPDVPRTSAESRFSPLLIGEQTATSDGCRDRHPRWRRFSPLLIGEQTATERPARASVGDRSVVSVPSSSGNKLRPAVALHRRHRHQFQSPPHRGTNCDSDPTCRTPRQRLVVSVPSSSGNKLRPRQRPRARRARVSVPSSSGNKLRPTGRDVAAMPDPSSFQSPPHRGTNCDSDAAVSAVQTALRFSPLLIGEQTATLTAGRVRCLLHQFQSPPHRGTNCDFTMDRSIGDPRYLVSVPSSSGNKLRPTSPTPAHVRSCSEFQSPPHRGTNCDSLRMHVSVQCIAFQSPPHRGTNCDARSAAAFGMRPQGFSPLLIGEQTATRRATCHRSAPPTFQSPPHRGTNCDSTARAIAVDARASVSVPSSSGNKLRLRLARCDVGESPSFQSPPHRGTNCDSPACAYAWHDCLFQSPPHRGTNCDVDRRLTAMAQFHVSVPSSSGNKLRLGTWPAMCHARSVFQSPPHRGTNCD